MIPQKDTYKNTMLIEGILWIIEAVLFLILFWIMQVHTNTLYLVQGEWRPMAENGGVGTRRAFIIRAGKQIPLSYKDWRRGLTEGEIRRQKMMAAKRMATQLRKESTKFFGVGHN